MYLGYLIFYSIFMFILFSLIIFRGEEYWLWKEKKITLAMFHEITSNFEKS